MPMSPTQLTIRKWRDAGYECAVVEKWNPHARIRQDLFGFVDVLVVGNGETIGIQCTTDKNVGSRVRKIEEMPEMVATLRDAGWVLHVEGWAKQKNRWKSRTVDIS